MAQDTILNVWVEGQIHSDGVSLSLLSESQDGGARVEAVENLSFEELESREGGLFNMGLSDETQSAFAETNRLAQVGKIFESQPQVSEGDVLIDDNPAPWSDDDRIVVENVTNITAKDYQLDDQIGTVASANPSYPEDDRVVEGHYQGSVKTYAFPESRLVQP